MTQCRAMVSYSLFFSNLILDLRESLAEGANSSVPNLGVVKVKLD
jgi:hypothetical protein